MHMTPPTGRCAICGSKIEGEPLLFEGSPVCDAHRNEIESSHWRMIGHYRRKDLGEHRRDAVLACIPCCLLVETREPDGFALYVRERDGDEALRALADLYAELVVCRECEMEYGKELPCCPVCGERAENHPLRQAKISDTPRGRKE